MKGHTSIWYFSGILLLVYGLLILATGIWELSHPLANPPVLSDLHAPIWWGGIMALGGFFYTVKFRPR
ncbi:MAG TPA: hypothetical protein VL990_18280 [Acidobacteriaceae bacterium]|nr:hypothetical protein [Acidobacteriaceae bacterium]